MKDIEIAQKAEKKDIREVAKNIGVCAEDLILYGYDKAKLKCSYGNKKANLILVTAINPTPFGEGKTTVSIGLGDALHDMKKNSIIVLREPSMGPYSVLKVVQLVVVIVKLFLWKILIFILRVIFML